jgi:glycosyltransferase involved in cell wall biosynthesis
MRILYFSRYYTPHDRRFLAALASSPHEGWYLRLENEVTQYERRAVPDGIRELVPLGGGQRLVSPEQWFRLAPQLESVLDQVRPDLVHGGSIQTGAFLTALVGFHPLLAMSWGSDILVDSRRDEFWKWMTRFTLRRADMLLTDCTEVSEAATQLTGFDPGRVVQFPWGVDTHCYHSGPDTLQLRKRSGWEGSVIVLCTRSWEPNYGVMDLLKAFHIAWKKMPRLRLVLLGSGSLKTDIEQFVREQGLAEAVLLPGAITPEQMPEYLRAADVYASCAYSDGSSVSLLEAMATGLPVLATDRASNREWVVSPGHGLLVPFGDRPAIAAGLLELSSLSPERRSGMAACNRAMIEQRADWSLNIAKLLAAYRALRPDLANETT